MNSLKIRYRNWLEDIYATSWMLFKRRTELF